MKKLILSMALFCALLMPCFSQKEYDSYLLEKFAELTADYNEGEIYYDQKEYEKAIEAYTKVFCNASFHYGREEWRVAERKKEIEDEFGPQLKYENICSNLKINGKTVQFNNCQEKQKNAR